MRLFKKLIYSSLMVLGLIFMGNSTFAQTTNTNTTWPTWFTVALSTNVTHFNKGEFDVSLAPTYTIQSPFTSSKHNGLYGISLETEYWQTASTGTGLEIGTTDIKGTGSIVDHIAILEDYRYVPFPNTKFWNQFDIEGKSGAETYLSDNSKGFEVGLGIDFDLIILKHHLRSDISVMQHISTNQQRNNLTAKWDIKLFSF